MYTGCVVKVPGHLDTFRMDGDINTILLSNILKYLLWGDENFSSYFEKGVKRGTRNGLNINPYLVICHWKGLLTRNILTLSL